MTREQIFLHLVNHATSPGLCQTETGRSGERPAGLPARRAIGPRTGRANPPTAPFQALPRTVFPLSWHHGSWGRKRNRGKAMDAGGRRGRIAEEAAKRTGSLDLSGLRGLTALPKSIATLTHLRELDCSRTSVSTFPRCPVSADIGTSVSDLSALSGLSGLQHLLLGLSGLPDCSFRYLCLRPFRAVRSQRSTAPVSDCSELFYLCLRPFRAVRSQRSTAPELFFYLCLRTLSGLSGLQRLNCSSTSVSDLSALSGLSGLQRLNCSSTSVSDLSALSGLSGLQRLN